ncbi:MAG: hypothetical protein ACXVAX_04245 [Pseudobdellovibrio sp.]
MGFYKVNKVTSKVKSKAAIEKLKEFKTWAQVKSPKSLQSALSYTLDWLAPELLGTGFRMHEVGELSFKAIVPARDANLDFQKEIHQGLVLNASVELARAFLQIQMGESFFRIVGFENKITKTQKWEQDLELHLETDQATLDDFFIDLQKKKKAEINFEINIKNKSLRKSDLVKLCLDIEKVELLA